MFRVFARRHTKASHRHRGTTSWETDLSMRPHTMAPFVAVFVLLSSTGCDRQSDETSNESAASVQQPVVVQLNWYPEAEHGGVYQALADGTYQETGLEVEVRPGGQASSVAPELQLGRVDFAFANADDVVMFRRQGIDVVAVLAAMQNSPRCILVQQASGVEDFDDLAGMTLQRQPGRSFLAFLRSQGVLDEVQEVPYFGSVSSLVTDPKIAIQAYSFAEPRLARQAGVEVRALMVSDLGWNPYSSVIITTEEKIRKQPDLVRRFVEATQTGWQNHLQDPTAGNAAILVANEHGMTQEALDFGSSELVALALPEQLPLEEVGRMSLERWQTLVEQMDQLDPDQQGSVDPEACFTNEFLQ